MLKCRKLRQARIVVVTDVYGTVANKSASTLPPPIIAIARPAPFYSTHF